MSAHEKLVMGVFTAGAVLNVVGGLALIPGYGLVGAATSSAVEPRAWFRFSCALLARQKLGVDGTVFARLPERST